MVVGANEELIGYVKGGVFYGTDGERKASLKKARPSRNSSNPGNDDYFVFGDLIFRSGEEVGRIVRRAWKRIVPLTLALILALVSFCAVAIPITLEKPYTTVEIYDKNGEWSSSRGIDFFSGRLLMPGAKGEYIFTVKNGGNVKLKTELRLISGYIGETEAKLPLKFNLLANGRVVALEEVGNDLKSGNIEIAAGESVTFMYEWEWLFDEDDDRDTALGVSGISGDYTILITATADIKGTNK